MPQDGSGPNKPSSIDDFYAKYPNADEVFFDEDGENIYLALFEADALAAAKQNQKRLYKTSDAPSVQRVYPTSFLYSIAYNDDNGDIAGIYVNGEDSAPLTMDEAGITSAFNDVLQTAGIFAQPTEVIATNNIFEIRVITSDDIAIQIEDENGVTYSLTQIFL